jgi:hypothetical protein
VEAVLDLVDDGGGEVCDGDGVPGRLVSAGDVTAGAGSVDELGAGDR